MIEIRELIDQKLKMYRSEVDVERTLSRYREILDEILIYLNVLSGPHKSYSTIKSSPDVRWQIPTSRSVFAFVYYADAYLVYIVLESSRTRTLQYEP